jgi:hypothetical protein
VGLSRAFGTTARHAGTVGRFPHIWGCANKWLGRTAEGVESGPTEMIQRHRSTCLGQDEHQKWTRDLRAAAAAPLHISRGESDASHASFRPGDVVVRGVEVRDRHERATRVFTRSTKCSENVLAVDDRLTEKGGDGRGWVRLRVDPRAKGSNQLLGCIGSRDPANVPTDRELWAETAGYEVAAEVADVGKRSH